MVQATGYRRAPIIAATVALPLYGGESPDFLPLSFQRYQDTGQLSLLSDLPERSP